MEKNHKDTEEKCNQWARMIQLRNHKLLGLSSIRSVLTLMCADERSSANQSSAARTWVQMHRYIWFG